MKKETRSSVTLPSAQSLKRQFSTGNLSSLNSADVQMTIVDAYLLKGKPLFSQVKRLICIDFLIFFFRRDILDTKMKGKVIHECIRVRSYSEYTCRVYVCVLMRIRVCA